MLSRWIAREGDRAFITRCLTEEGPRHHRESTAAILLLLDALLSQLPGAPAPPDATGVKVPLRLPPHVADHLDPHDAHYPLTMPTRAIAELGLTPGEVDVIAEHLVDGPPHHALANALMVSMLTDALRRVTEAKG